VAVVAAIAPVGMECLIAGSMPMNETF
jgi:hypothetical protein